LNYIAICSPDNTYNMSSQHVCNIRNQLHTTYLLCTFTSEGKHCCTTLTKCYWRHCRYTFDTQHMTIQMSCIIVPLNYSASFCHRTKVTMCLNMSLSNCTGIQGWSSLMAVHTASGGGMTLVSKPGDGRTDIAPFARRIFCFPPFFKGQHPKRQMDRLIDWACTCNF